jgi:hypothetical protein
MSTTASFDDVDRGASLMSIREYAEYATSGAQA